jgi:hypothetical protein
MKEPPVNMALSEFLGLIDGPTFPGKLCQKTACGRHFRGKLEGKTGRRPPGRCLCIPAAGVAVTVRPDSGCPIREAVRTCLAEFHGRRARFIANHDQAFVPGAYDDGEGRLRDGGPRRGDEVVRQRRKSTVTRDGCNELRRPPMKRSRHWGGWIALTKCCLDERIRVGVGPWPTTNVHICSLGTSPGPASVLSLSRQSGERAREGQKIRLHQIMTYGEDGKVGRRWDSERLMAGRSVTRGARA